MELRLVRAFLAVADEQHFGRAARRLHLAQPALSQQVKTLEQQLGVSLFDRTTRRVDLTAAGLRFQDHARRIVAAADHAVLDMERLATGRAGRVSAGFIGTATYDLLPRLARAVREQMPDVDLRLRGELLSPRLLEGLEALEFDLVVHRPIAGTPREIETFPLRTERFVAALPVGHALAEEAELDLARLAGESFVIHPHGVSAMHEWVLAACADAGFRPPAMIEVAETATLATFVAAGLGVALVPEPVRSLALDGVVYVPLRAAFEVALLVSVRAGERVGPVREFVDILERITTDPRVR
jgi:DNA-binding transcriptional LysR family regulator